jgi:hypothetical protein
VAIRVDAKPMQIKEGLAVGGTEGVNTTAIGTEAEAVQLLAPVPIQV